MAKKTYIFFCLIFVLFYSACANQGTEVGNPGKRVVSGTLAAAVNSLNTKSLRQAISSPADSCPTIAGNITIIFRTPSGKEVDTPTQSDGFFSSEIDNTKNYEIVFQQNNVDCGFLYYSDNQNNAGLHVVLGNGTEDIIMGDINDLGDGVFVAQNNPSSYCDNDDDGLTDDVDDDANDDGLSDDDEDDDGYTDWFEDEEGEQEEL